MHTGMARMLALQASPYVAALSILEAVVQPEVRGVCRFDVEGMVTLSGRDAGADDAPPAAATAAALRLVVDAGALGVAKSATPPMNLGCAPDNTLSHPLLTLGHAFVGSLSSAPSLQGSGH